MNPVTKSKKRVAILAGAHRVFAREGFDGASMEGVAREAGVAKPTLYNHFRDKNSLYVAVVEDALSKTRDEILPSGIENEPAAEAIRKIARRLTVMFGRDDEVLKLCRICIGGFERFPLGSTTLMVHGPQRGSSQISALIERWRAKGELTCDDPQMAAWQLHELCKVSIWDARLYRARQKIPLEECEAVAEEAYLTFMARFGP